MLMHFYTPGALMKRRAKQPRGNGAGGKVAREIAAGSAWQPKFVIDGWPPPSFGLEAWPPLISGDRWPGGSGWEVEASPFPPDVEIDPFRVSRDLHTTKGQWYASLDRNFPGWETWDGNVTVDMNRQ